MHSEKPKKKWKTYAVIFLSAILAHMMLLVLGWWTAKWLEWGKPKRDLAYRQFQISLETEEEEKKEPHKQRQVVAIQQPEKERKPDKARFVSEYDSKVEKETQSREKRVASEISSTYSPKPQPATPPSSPSRPDERQRTHRDLEKELKPPPSALSMRTTPLDDPEHRMEETKPKEEDHEDKETEDVQEPGRDPRKARTLSPSDLKLSDQQLAKAIGAPFPDHLGDVPEGDKTLLDTQRWKFSSFFNRVKTAVAQQWQPGTVYRRHDPTGKIYGFRSRLTVLRVTLDGEGNIKSVVLNRSCGLSFLDDEAIRAFRAAGPFPNPPSRLVDPKTNTISFSFGFLFEITKGPSFRIFRYR